MKELVIVGAGGMGRELLQWVKDINAAHIRKGTGPRWAVKGFIDDNLNALDGIACDYRVTGTIAGCTPAENEEYALSIASPQVKEKLSAFLKARGAVFASIIHPTAQICDFTEHGEGLVMYPRSSLNPNCRVGNFVTVLSSAIPHDATVDDFATISSNCGLTRGIHIGRMAFLAEHVSILPELRIGEKAYVGLGSVVVKDVPDGAKVFGNPARIIGPVNRNHETEN